MHPVRREIALRWGLYTLALLSPVVFWWTSRNVAAPVAQLPAAPKVALPKEDDERMVARCVAAMARTSTTPVAAVRATGKLLQEPSSNALDFKGLSLEQILSDKWNTTERIPHLSLVFFSGANRMAVLNGKVVRRGSRLRDGSRVLRIERHAVLVVRNGKVLRVPWHKPGLVRLSGSGS